MKGWRCAAAAAFLAAAAALSIVVYGNFHSAYASKKAGLTPEEKIAVLSRANALWPVLDQTLMEEGKAHLDLALDVLPDTAGAERSLRRAEGLLRRALRLNPASAAGHLVYSRTLRYLSFLSEDEAPASFPELWKAALLSGKRSPLDFDLCRDLLEHWSDLDGPQRDFTLNLVREILKREKRGQFPEILQAWSLHVGDDALLEKALPDSASLLRTYARFLGEKSHSLEMRRRLLARAERIDYDRAVKENDAGNPDACLRLLDGIRYYAGLSGETDIAPDVLKHRLLRKDALLNRAKAGLMKSRKLEDAEADLRAYLGLEDSFNQVLALEGFLREINILREESSIRPDVHDLRRLAFEVFLMFKLNKYTSITALGGAVQGGVIVLDNAQKPFLAEVYTLIADAYDKLNFIYEPEGFYIKARELEPGNRTVLFKLHRYYERLNEKGKMAEVERALSGALTPPTMNLADTVILKGRSRTFGLALLPGPARLALKFQGREEVEKLLVSVLFNNRVIWEDFLPGLELNLEVEAGLGGDRLEISAINRAVRPLELKWSPDRPGLPLEVQY